MGKRQNETGDNKRGKKHKRHHKGEKHHQKRAAGSPKAATNKQQVEEPAHMFDEVLEGFEHEEEIVCDGEVELPAGDNSELIDVEDDTEEEVVVTPTHTPTPTPTKASTSKTSASKKHHCKQTTPPQAATTAGKTLTPTGAVTAANATASNSANVKKAKKRRDSGATSSEEERWLTAIESGKLEDVDDELKKIKDPKLMTARQRAMYERQLDKEPTSPGAGGIAAELLMSLPTGYREREKPLTAEDIQKAALKSQKRKQLADEKREKDKKKTMERLLKKQETNKQRAAARSKVSKAALPMITYRNTLDGAYIQLPPEHQFPLAAQTAREPPAVQLCGIAGCGQRKVYNCSKTNLPLCSFACYRKHVQAVRQIMC